MQTRRADEATDATTPGDAARRTPGGDVILGSAHPTPAARRRLDRHTVLRRTAVSLSVLAALALVVTAVLAGSRSAAQSDGPGGPAAPPSAGANGTVHPPALTSATRPGQPAPTEPDAGGVSAARARVSEFVGALNTADFDRANGLLCRFMAGRYGTSSLDGIEPGSLGVGGVSVQGSTGTAIVTYQPTGGGIEERSLFGLRIEHQQWVLCAPQ